MLPLSWLKSLASTCTSLGLLLHCDGEDYDDQDADDDHDDDDYDDGDDDDDEEEEEEDDEDDDDDNYHDDVDEGARLLHSSTALGIGPDRLLEGFNSSTLCLRLVRVKTSPTESES